MSKPQCKRNTEPDQQHDQQCLSKTQNNPLTESSQEQHIRTADQNSTMYTSNCGRRYLVLECKAFRVHCDYFSVPRISDLLTNETPIQSRAIRAMCMLWSSTLCLFNVPCSSDPLTNESATQSRTVRAMCHALDQVKHRRGWTTWPFSETTCR
jgi:hypothetical protein